MTLIYNELRYNEGLKILVQICDQGPQKPTKMKRNLKKKFFIPMVISTKLVEHECNYNEISKFKFNFMISIISTTQLIMRKKFRLK